MSNFICCFNSCKLRQALNELIDERNDVADFRRRELIIQDTLQAQWHRIFTQNVINRLNNRQCLAKKIEYLLINLPPGTEPKNFLVLYVRAVQIFLTTIRTETSTLHFKQHFQHLENTTIAEVNLVSHEDNQELAFLIRFTNDKSIVCFPPNYMNASPILDDSAISIVQLPLEEDGFRVTEEGNQYYRALTDEEITATARAEVEAIDFQLGDIEINREYLTKKIQFILSDHRQPLDQKRQIIEQVKQDAVNYIHQTIDHIQQDLATDENFKTAFHLYGDELLKKIEVLGQETHNSGKTPLLITFNNGKRIVYKARSLKTESLICSNQQYSLFSHAHLPTYTIIQKGSYGYAQYLENLPNENLFETEQQIDQYFAKFIQMDKIISPLRGSDFHSENVVTQNKAPYLVDTEVVMGPIPAETLLAAKDSQAAWVFDENSHNRIWLTIELANEFGLQTNQDLPDGAEFCDFFKDKFDRLHPQIPEISQKIQRTRDFLSHFRHRIVAIPSAPLSQFIKMSSEKGFREFLKQLRNDLPQHSLVFIEENIPSIQRQFDIDVQHNDVPIFYYDCQREECFYQNILIGRKTHP